MLCLHALFSLPAGLMTETRFGAIAQPPFGNVGDFSAARLTLRKVEHRQI